MLLMQLGEQEMKHDDHWIKNSGITLLTAFLYCWFTTLVIDSRHTWSLLELISAETI